MGNRPIGQEIEMNACIVTMNSSYNYGAMLQAYALQQKLCSMGIESAFVDRRTTREAKVHIDKRARGLLKAPFVLLHKNAFDCILRSKAYNRLYQKLVKSPFGTHVN
ncbi:MAG: hypothetical protein ACI4K9_06355 [Candidatus Fimenecus sp.]